MFTKTYSKKQMGVVYRAFKEGKINITKEDVSYLYDMADGMEVWNTNDSKLAGTSYHGMKNAVQFIFDGEYSNAQVSIDNMLTA